MKMHSVAEFRRSYVVKRETLLHGVKKMVLKCQNKMAIYVFKGSNFMVQLNQDGFRTHLPVHAIAVRGGFFHLQTDRSEKLLTLCPQGSRCIQPCISDKAKATRQGMSICVLST